MHRHAGFGGSDASSGAAPTQQEELAVLEERRLFALVELPAMARWCAALGCLVPKDFPDTHPEVQKSIATVRAKLGGER